jgi:hypothetical protein
VVGKLGALVMPVRKNSPAESTVTALALVNPKVVGATVPLAISAVLSPK